MCSQIIALAAIFILINASSFYDNPEQDPLPSEDYPSHDDDLHKKWDFEWAFSGISTFAHLKHVKCLSDRSTPFDIGIIGTGCQWLCAEHIN